MSEHGPDACGADVIGNAGKLVEEGLVALEDLYVGVGDLVVDYSVDDIRTARGDTGYRSVSPGVVRLGSRTQYGAESAGGGNGERVCGVCPLDCQPPVTDDVSIPRGQQLENHRQAVVWEIEGVIPALLAAFIAEGEAGRGASEMDRHRCLGGRREERELSR